MVALVIIVALSAIGAVGYLGLWALKQGSATSPKAVCHMAPTKGKKK